MRGGLIGILIFFNFAYLFSQEFHILRDTPIWDWEENLLNDSTISEIIKKGSVVTDVDAPILAKINDEFCFIHSSILYAGKKYSIEANTLSSKDTEELFDSTFLTSADPESTIWVNAYFLDAMRTGDRDILIFHEKRLFNSIKPHEYGQWYEYGDFAKSLLVTQATLSIGGLVLDQFWIQKIKYISNGYCITVTWNTADDETYEMDSLLRSLKVNLPRRKQIPMFNLYFIFDGSYLDIFYTEGIENTTKIFCSTFVRIDAEIRRQIDGIILYNEYYPDLYESYDPTKLTYWPRRADGSMDYPPPQPTQAAVTEQPETANIADDGEAAEPDPAEETAAQQATTGFPWVIMAIIAGIVVIGGATAFVVILRKKK
jgi:hypothetical protein